MSQGRPAPAHGPSARGAGIAPFGPDADVRVEADDSAPSRGHGWSRESPARWTSPGADWEGHAPRAASISGSDPEISSLRVLDLPEETRYSSEREAWHAVRRSVRFAAARVICGPRRRAADAQAGASVASFASIEALLGQVEVGGVRRARPRSGSGGRKRAVASAGSSRAVALAPARR